MLSWPFCTLREPSEFAWKHGKCLRLGTRALLLSPRATCLLASSVAVSGTGTHRRGALTWGQRPPQDQGVTGPLPPRRTAGSVRTHALTWEGAPAGTRPLGHAGGLLMGSFPIPRMPGEHNFPEQWSLHTAPAWVSLRTRPSDGREVPRCAVLTGPLTAGRHDEPQGLGTR